MDYWFQFLDGLAHAYSWVEGQDNALIGQPHDWPYLAGLLLHFWLVTALYLFCFYKIFKNRIQDGSWQPTLKRLKEQAALRGRFKTILGWIIGLPMIFLFFPYYEGQRIANGLWRYQYFHSQETQQQAAVVEDIQTAIGSKSSYSRITMKITIGQDQRTINISNSSKSRARALRDEFETPAIIQVYVNSKNQVVFID